MRGQGKLPGERGICKEAGKASNHWSDEEGEGSFHSERYRGNPGGPRSEAERGL